MRRSARDQNPLGPDTMIEPWQIEEDLAQLKPLTDCVRTYSIDHGLDQIPEIAQRHGLKVMQGCGCRACPELNRKQIDTGDRARQALSRRHRGGDRRQRGAAARRNVGAASSRSTIREVKAQVPMPVTYADVWEFWLRHRDVAAAVDFVTIHILPYWEDFPIPAGEAARACRRRSASRSSPPFPARRS